eukprot:IDg3968t1
MSTGNERRTALLTVLQAGESMMDDADCVLACELAETASRAEIMYCLPTMTERAGSRIGRKQLVVRNDPDWLFRYAMRSDYIVSSDWRSMFRIPHPMFINVADKIRPDVQRSVTSFRLPVPSEKKLAAFLMTASNATYRRVASQLGMGPSTVMESVREVSRAICTLYSDYVKLPSTASEIGSLMNGFERIAGLPYCVGAIDGTHIPWKKCPASQFYEYRCYKGFESLILFALSSADRRIIYADIGAPGVLGDSTLFDRSKLKQKLFSRQWPGYFVPLLSIGDITVAPYIMGDGAFSLSKHVMKTCSKDEITSDPDLAEWEKRATKTRKSVECAFGILKHRFSTLMNGIMLDNEDDAVFYHGMCHPPQHVFRQ